MAEKVEQCSCLEPGYSYCGVPGIIAHRVEGRVPPDAAVQRCDCCQLYTDDDAARRRLIELGLLSAADLVSSRYTVHCYANVRVKFSGITASDPREAARQAERSFDWDLHRESAEFAEEFSEFLVDVEGASDFSGSLSFNADFQPTDS